ncbi:MAG: FimB/Mfa2 family fimbrial subunit [bacterium]
MDYEEMNERMLAEREDRRHVEGLVKLLWTGIIVAGVLIAFGIVLLLTACSKESTTTDTTGTAAVKVTVNDFSITTEDFPTKDAVAAYTGVKAMTLAFFDAQGNEVYNTTQLRADNTTYTTFGEFELSLNLGSYTMIVLGYGSEVPMTVGSATEASYTADRVRETFVASQAVNVTSTNPLTLNAELSRVVSKVIVRSTDTRTAGVDSVRVTFAAGGKGVNPQTGLASSNNGLSNCVAISSAVGAASSTISYLFLASDQQTMNVTVETIKTNGTVYSTRTVADVPLQRNKITVLRGPMYSTASGASFTVSTSWIGDTTRVSF